MVVWILPSLYLYLRLQGLDEGTEDVNESQQGIQKPARHNDGMGGVSRSLLPHGFSLPPPSVTRGSEGLGMPLSFLERPCALRKPARHARLARAKRVNRCDGNGHINRHRARE